MRVEINRRQRIVFIGIAIILIYGAWIGAPYLRSIVSRDAAVTTWITVTSSPIAGHVDLNPRYPGERVGSDGIIVKVINPRVDPMPLAKAQADLDRARARVTALAKRIADTQRIVGERSAVAERYALLFKQDVEARLAGAGGILSLTRQRVDIERTQAGRIVTLTRKGTASQSAADAAAGGVTDQARALTGIETTINRARLHRQAADDGVFMLEDRTDGADAQRSLSDARLELSRVEEDQAIAQADADAALLVFDAAHEAFERAASAGVSAPPRALVWSLITGPGATVEPGMPVATWLDCSIMLVDVPIADVEIALLRVGAIADVLLEGERHTRHGTVALLRGSASTLGPHDLAAIAKGRHPGTGQALVKLDALPADIESCPIGHAAFVDFPGIGLFDVVKARLRL